MISQLKMTKTLCEVKLPLLKQLRHSSVKVNDGDDGNDVSNW